MAKIKVSTLASKKASIKRALTKAAAAAAARAAKSSKPTKPAKKAATKGAAPAPTLEPKKVGTIKVKLGRPRKLMPSAECSCEPATAKEEPAGLPWRYIVNPDGSTSAYPVDEVNRLSAKLAAEQGASIHTLQIPRRTRIIETHTGYTSLSHTGDGVEDQLAADARAPKKRMGAAGPAKHPSTPIYEEDPSNTAAEQEVYAIYHQREDFYTTIADAKSKAFIDISDLSGVAAAVDAIADDVFSDPHIIVNDRQRVLGQILQKALAAANDRIPKKVGRSAAEDSRTIALTKVYEDLRKMMEPAPQSAPAAESNSESECQSMDDRQSDCVPGPSPEPAAARPTVAGACSRKYAEYLSIAGMDHQEVLSLSDEYHEPMLKVLTMHGCSIVSMDPSHDIDFSGNTDGTATIEVVSLVRDTADGSDTQIGLLFLGSKSGFTGVEAVTAGWDVAELIDVNFGSCSRVYLMQKS